MGGFEVRKPVTVVCREVRYGKVLLFLSPGSGTEARVEVR